MAQQTALMELFTWVRNSQTIDIDTQYMLEEKINSLYEKEKLEIRRAYMNGQQDMEIEIKRNGDFAVRNSSLEYYNKTFIL